MSFFSRDDDGLGLVAIIIIGILALLFIFQFCNFTSKPPCPEGSYECASSPCGCCKQNSDGSVDVCSACDDYISVGGKCCQKSNPQQCVELIKQCVYPSSCTADAECSVDPCPESKCELQSNGQGACKPCAVGAVCNSEDPNSCCSGMVCSEGKCAPADKCLTKCTTDTECKAIPGCSNYGCNLLKNICENCENKQCKTTADCCSGAKWGCVNGLCVDCFSSCDPSQQNCPCSGTKCINGKCTGCDEGAPCDKDHPCCEGYTCNLESGKCESCNRQCTDNTECCAGGLCVNGVCAYSNSCNNLPCTNPTEPCKVCTSSDSCLTCTDNTICAKSNSGFVCKPQGNCPAGQYECDDPNCPTGCCDALTGECACGEGGHPCKTLEGCGCCIDGEKTALACPENTYLCPDYGCTEIAPDCSLMGGKLVCKVTKPQCPSGTFTCKDNNGCCAYIVPADGVPSGISSVDTSTCFSGYGYSEIKNIGNIPLLTTVCCDSVTYTKSGDTFKYTFVCGGKTYKDTSKVSPYEVIITSTLQFDNDYCTKVASKCTSEGKKLEDCFTKPIMIKIGGK